MLGLLNAQESKIVEIFVSRLKNLLGDNLILLKLFGSKVHGNYSPDSDIDLLLVLKEENLQIHDAIYDLLCGEIDPYYDYKISLIIYTEFEYKKNEELRSPFIETVKKEGITL